jgi:hypothetical protein
MAGVDDELAVLAGLESSGLRDEWRRLYRTEPPPYLSRDLLVRAVAYRVQERALGGLTAMTRRRLHSLAQNLAAGRSAALEASAGFKPGSRLVREWHRRTHTVTVLDDGFEYEGERYRSLTQIARLITGARWSGPRFFGLARAGKPAVAGADHE